MHSSISIMYGIGSVTLCVSYFQIASCRPLVAGAPHRCIALHYQHLPWNIYIFYMVGQNMLRTYEVKRSFPKKIGFNDSFDVTKCLEKFHPYLGTVF